MLKSFTGKFGHGVAEDPSNMDQVARKPDAPGHKREKKEKRQKGIPNDVDSGPTPDIFHKHEKHELKHGHDPNKIHGAGVPTRKIIVEPSQRHSQRNLNSQGSSRNLDSESAGTENTRNLDVKNGMRTMTDHQNMRNTSGIERRSSSKNTSGTERRSSPKNTSSTERRSSSNNTKGTERRSSSNSTRGTERRSSSKNTNSGKKTSTLSPNGVNEMNSLIDERNARNIRSVIDENDPRNIGPNNPSSSINSKSTVSTSTNSTISASSTGSPTNKNSGNVSNKGIIEADSGADNESTSNHSRSNHSRSNHSSSVNNRSSHSNGNSKSNHSDKTRNVDNRSPGKNRDRIPRPRQSPRKRSGSSAATPVHLNRERPSTALITRKELEEILAAKRREELMDQKTLPPKSGTLSTDLWVAAAQIHNNTQSEEFSVASGTSVEEDDPFGKHQNRAESEQQYEQQYDPVNRYDPTDQRSDEYDINFFDIPEEEITEHTVTSGHMDDGQMDSFDADELNLAASMDSMEQRSTTIRFDEYDELQTCLHINDYTKGEISRSWYKREDYDKMVDLARKTASKAVKREKELRDELQDVLKPDDNDTSRSGRSTGPDGKRKKPIEYRGLEAWTPEGSQKCRTMKENAIELVWNEQSRQWEDGTFDPDAISAVYIPVAQQALEIAHERALADEKMVKKLIDQDEARKQKKKNRTIIRKGRSLMTKTAKNTGKMLGQGAEKVLKETGKGAVKIGKRGVKAVVATATLDQKMMKEAVKIRVHGKKKRECKHEKEIAPSKASHQRDVDKMEESLARSEESGMYNIFLQTFQKLWGAFILFL